MAKTRKARKPQPQPWAFRIIENPEGTVAAVTEVVEAMREKGEEPSHIVVGVNLWPPFERAERLAQGKKCRGKIERTMLPTGVRTVLGGSAIAPGRVKVVGSEGSEVILALKSTRAVAPEGGPEIEAVSIWDRLSEEDD